VKWRHRIYGHDTIAILWVWNAIIRGENLPCYSNKIQLVCLRKHPYDHYPTDKAYLIDITVANISRSLTHKMAPRTSWQRYETKLRHCHPMYIIVGFRLQMLCFRRSGHAEFAAVGSRWWRCCCWWWWWWWRWCGDADVPRVRHQLKAIAVGTSTAVPVDRGRSAAERDRSKQRVEHQRRTWLGTLVQLQNPRARLSFTVVA